VVRLIWLRRNAFVFCKDDCHPFLASISSALVGHTRRAANQVAHTLAKSALKFLLDCVLIEECPSYIHNIVLAF
jgi:hypothetical protein